MLPEAGSSSSKLSGFMITSCNAMPAGQALLLGARLSGDRKLQAEAPSCSKR